MPWGLKGTKKNRLKEEVLERDGPACHWCGVETVAVPSGYLGTLLDEHRTLDHVRRRRDGGPDQVGNLVIACNLCNHGDGQCSGSAGLITESELADLMG